jgi:hypothetical protein
VLPGLTGEELQRGEAGVEFDGAGEIGVGFVGPAQGLAGQATAVQGDGVVRGRAQGGVEGVERFDVRPQVRA